MYIKEAHPEDGWQMPKNKQEGIEVNQPKTDNERDKVATTCATKLALTIPFVVDGMDNKVGEVYAGWPDRIYVVGKDGKITYKGGPGPAGFSVKEMEAKLADIVKGKAGEKKE